MIISPAGLGTKNDWAGEGQQRLDLKECKVWLRVQMHYNYHVHFALHRLLLLLLIHMLKN
jgi:hypothetical protein